MNKKQAAIFTIIGILLASSLALAFETAVAKPPVQLNIANRQMQASWLRMNGNITEWGTTDVRGQLQTQARSAAFQSSDTKQLTGATAIWSTNVTKEIQSVRAKENFTYVYYVARLPNASVSTLSSSSGNYFLNGTWNLATVTSTITITTNENGTITKVHRDQDITPNQAYGELTITDNKFTLSINGMETLTGAVYRSITRSWVNPFKMTDDIENKVSKTDVREVAKCYGAMPGWGNFDIKMDFNNNYRVDIADISTVAAKI